MSYVYFWLRSDGTPYYVGKGTGRRGFKQEGHRVRRPELTRILVQEYDSEADAFAAEMFFIDFYGRLDLGTGCLANLTNGGEGVSGFVPSPTLRLLWSKQRRENPSSGFRGHCHGTEFRKTITKANHQRVWSFESVAKVKDAARNKPRIGGRFVKAG